MRGTFDNIINENAFANGRDVATSIAHYMETIISLIRSDVPLAPANGRGEGRGVRPSRRSAEDAGDAAEVKRRSAEPNKPYAELRRKLGLA